MYTPPEPHSQRPPSHPTPTGYGERSLTVITGDAGACRQAALKTLSHVSHARWIGHTAPDHIVSVSVRGARQWLGTECDALVFDAHDGFDPDALGAAAGTVRAGGALLLLTPPLDHWPDCPDPVNERVAVHGTTVTRSGYLSRCARMLRQLPCDIRAATSASISQPQSASQRTWQMPDQPTSDQRKLVAALTTALASPTPYVAVVRADRGRGKSAALGQLAAALAQQGRRVVVTAPRRTACDILFQHAETSWPHNDGVPALRFSAPDQVHAMEDRDILLVDEAGGLHVGLTQQLLQHWNHVVFAGTVHGYEGAGRGFETRFRHLLDGLPHRSAQFTLDTPLRWPEGDPLETCINALLILDADCPAAHTSTECRWLDRDHLLTDEPYLRALYALLSTAHYRTRPLDLRQLLDGPNLRLAVIDSDDQPLAAALIATEGEFTDPNVIDAIAEGNRRPRGHLLPQLLTWQYQHRDACEHRWWRVVRIAVHPDFQGQGIGSALLRWLRTEAQTDGVDALCTSFGADQSVLSFWQGAHYQPVYLGHVREATSGAFALAMVAALSARSKALAARVETDFNTRWRQRTDIPAWLASHLERLDSPRAD